MSFVQTVCPNCRMSTMVDDSRRICYCLYCGYRIDVGDTGAGGLEFNPGVTVARAEARVETKVTSSVSTDGKVPVRITIPGSTAAIRVIVDGKDAFESFGGTDTLLIRPGHHKVTMKLGLTSASVEGDLTEGSHVIFELKGFAKYSGRLERP